MGFINPGSTLFVGLTLCLAYPVICVFFVISIDQGPGSDVYFPLTFQLGKRLSFVDFSKAPRGERRKVVQPLNFARFILYGVGWTYMI